jgi:hypothetical protein
MSQLAAEAEVAVVTVRTSTSVREKNIQVSVVHFNATNDAVVTRWYWRLSRRHIVVAASSHTDILAS